MRFVHGISTGAIRSNDQRGFMCIDIQAGTILSELSTVASAGVSYTYILLETGDFLEREDGTLFIREENA